MESTSHVYSDTGTYQVTLIVENHDACRDTLTLSLKVQSENGIFYAPNAIHLNSSTPENCSFKPFIYELDKNSYHMLVYNRWGEKIFETFNYHRAWDGTGKSGKPVQLGSYPWIIIFKDMEGKPWRESGSVLVID